MRLLFLTNFYPPAHLGGKEIRCREVVEGLRSRGHTALVLTSNFVPPGRTVPDQPGVRRVLTLDAGVYHYQPVDQLLRGSTRLRSNVKAVETAITEFDPDLAFIWGMWNLSPAVAAAAEAKLPGRVVYSFGGYWPIQPDLHQEFWLTKDGKWLGRQFRRVLVPLALSSRYRPFSADSLRFDHAITCSDFVLRQLRGGGLALPHAKVVFSGIDVDWFSPAPQAPSGRPGELDVVYLGALIPRKGVPVAIEAMRLLSEWAQEDIRLTIVGEGHPHYRDELERAVRQHALAQQVSFRPAIPRRDVPRLLQEFDTLVLPSESIEPEPLSRTVMEAMACGLVVVGTNEGGTPEMITDGVDGFLFAPGDSEELAHHLRTLALDPELRRRLSAAARQTAEKRFRISRMIDEIERFLEEALTETQGPRSTQTMDTVMILPADQLGRHQTGNP